MTFLPRFASSNDYLISLRALQDLLPFAPILRQSDTYRIFIERFPAMDTPQDFQLILKTLKDLLIEFPDTTAPDAVSAKRQARAVLKKYQDLLRGSAENPKDVEDGHS